MYHPDKWTIVDYGEKWNEDRYAVMAGWGGSFTYGASWKRSSPMRSVVECGEDSFFEVLIKKDDTGCLRWVPSCCFKFIYRP